MPDRKKPRVVAKHTTAAPRLCVFVSKPSVVAEPYREGIERFHRRLAALRLDDVTLGSKKAVGHINPLRDVVQLVDQSHGMIVLGWPQIEIERGSHRGNSLENVSLATEWNHIEAAIARARGRPVVFLRERSVAARGLLDAASLGTYVHPIDGLRADWSDDLVNILRPFCRDMEAHRNAKVGYHELRVLSALRETTSRNAMTVAQLSKGLHHPSRDVLRILMSHVDGKRVDYQEFHDGSNEYWSTSHGKQFLHGFMTGTNWEVE